MGDSAGLWPLRIITRVVVVGGPCVGGSVAKVMAMQSHSLWVLMSGVVWLQLVQVVSDGKQWL